MSGRSSWRLTPVMRSTSKTRSTGTRRHWEIAWAEIPSRLANFRRFNAVNVFSKGSDTCFIQDVLSAALKIVKQYLIAYSKEMLYVWSMSMSVRIKAVMGDMTQTAFAEKIGVTTQAVNQWISGETKPGMTSLNKIAEKFGIDINWLAYGGGLLCSDNEPVRSSGRQSVQMAIGLPQPILAARDLPVFAAVEGGSGDLVISTEPVELVPRPWYMGEVKDGYGVIVTGESMYPAYEPGDTAIVNPRLPYMRGKVHIFTAESENSHFKGTIKLLTGVTEKEWKVEQFNPPKLFTLPRSIWTNARRVVGKYNG